MTCVYLCQRLPQTVVNWLFMRVRCCEKSSTFLTFTPSGEEKKVKEGSNCSDVVAQCENTLEGFGPGMCEVWPGDLGWSLNRNVQSISYNFESEILRTQG